MRRSPLLGLVLLAAVPLASGGRMGPTTTGASSSPSIRVLLLQSPLITVGAAGKDGLQLRDQAGHLLWRLPPGGQLRVRREGESLTLEPLPKGTDPLQADPTPLGPSAGPQPISTPVPLTVSGPPWEASKPSPRPLPLQELRLEPIRPQDVLVVKQRRYRGALLLRPEGTGLQAINRLPLENYLMGVVGSEMPGTWPLAALRAQAVASRTYALQQLRPKAPFDLQATVASQVYKGVEAESAPVRQAVTSTRGLVLMHGQRLINAVFHSSSGGLTENSGELWNRQLPYLVSVPDDDSSSPVSRWQKAFGPEALRQAFGEIGGAITIQPVETSSSGRVRRAKVIGPKGELLLSGSELRQRLGLRSTLVEFVFEPAERMDAATAPTNPVAPLANPSTTPPEASLTPEAAHDTPPSPSLVVRGRGYGHGVGMSQWGAYALALRGKSYEEILRHYYRGAVLRPY